MKTDVAVVEIVKRRDGTVYPHFMFSVPKASFAKELATWPHMKGRLVVTRFDRDGHLACFTRTRREGT